MGGGQGTTQELLILCSNCKTISGKQIESIVPCILHPPSSSVKTESYSAVKRIQQDGPNCIKNLSTDHLHLALGSISLLFGPGGWSFTNPSMYIHSFLCSACVKMVKLPS